MLTIQGKALGQRKPLFADFSVPLPPEIQDQERITLRDLISSVVRSEVKAFQERQESRQFIHVLTSREINQAAETGKITMGGSEVGLQEVDPEQAVKTALQAFQDGIYLVILDEVEQKNLDQEVFLNPESRMTFIRLTLLAGG